MPDSERKLLVAEDHPHVRELLSEMLERAGYRVVAVCDGKAALEVVASEAAQIGLVLCDAIMPGLCGAKLECAIREHLPNVPIVYMSAYFDHQVLAELLARPQSTCFLQKPFGKNELLSTVSGMLAPTASGVAAS